MQVAGFTIIRNALKYDYPVIEAITSILPICDVFYIGVGASEDDTRKLIESINSDKIKIIDTVWDDNLRQGGKVLSIETNKVFDQIPKEYDWCFYIQSDECVHEEDLPEIKEAMIRYNNNADVDGLLFEYKHFYGHYKYICIAILPAGKCNPFPIRRNPWACFVTLHGGKAGGLAIFYITLPQVAFKTKDNSEPVGCKTGVRQKISLLALYIDKRNQY